MIFHELNLKIPSSPGFASPYELKIFSPYRILSLGLAAPFLVSRFLILRFPPASPSHLALEDWYICMEESSLIRLSYSYHVFILCIHSTTCQFIPEWLSGPSREVARFSPGRSSLGKAIHTSIPLRALSFGHDLKDLNVRFHLSHKFTVFSYFRINLTPWTLG